MGLLGFSNAGPTYVLTQPYKLEWGMEEIYFDSKDDAVAFATKDCQDRIDGTGNYKKKDYGEDRR